ncbi:MAG: hypothetical protein FWG81_01955 [Betaproteobacteria bacterium]|nr:hypothetical protein [Betaproteobacteria bacterium]
MQLMPDTPVDSILARAAEIIDSGGDFQIAYDLLQPLLAAQDPAAQFIYAHFGLPGETRDELEARSINLLQSASDAGYPPAMYELAVCLDAGGSTVDLVAIDKIRAAALFKKAADAGYPKAKRIHGLDLFYGSNGISQDKALGIALLEQAVAANVYLAAEDLGWLRSREF